MTTKAVYSLQSGELQLEYREVLLRLGANPGDAALSKRADELGAEIDRRIAW